MCVFSPYLNLFSPTPSISYANVALLISSGFIFIQYCLVCYPMSQWWWYPQLINYVQWREIVKNEIHVLLINVNVSVKIKFHRIAPIEYITCACTVLSVLSYKYKCSWLSEELVIAYIFYAFRSLSINHLNLYDLHNLFVSDRIGPLTNNYID